MKEYIFDCVVIGGGAAGMAAALEVEKSGFDTAIVEREEHLGGILLQCIHNGFGLHEFKEELTGPEYAERFAERVQASSVKVFLESTVMELSESGEAAGMHELHCYSSVYGVFLLKARSVILSMGCRERNRGNIGIPGSRPSGIMTAGLAQRLVNIDGYIPGEQIVIIGSGDIGLIMARRMTWAGCKVHAVIEIQPYPSGITRNIVQCLEDFDIPLYLSHVVSEIRGKDRIESIRVTPLKNGIQDEENSFEIKCDTLLLSVGLVPENELSRKAGIELSPQINGPLVDSFLMTNKKGIFACGNVLHVHDLVDYVSRESRSAGSNVVKYLNSTLTGVQNKVKAGANVRYVVPQKFNFQGDNQFYMRSMIVKNGAKVEVRAGNIIIKTVNHNHVQPSEMISISIKKEELEKISGIPDQQLEISII
ncbi:MAG: FAD-dependent oxidoreductase [Spirochaetales bacterium]|nr:FAD-dependent oxidoreductase [Spirochaetales bacterium]